MTVFSLSYVKETPSQSASLEGLVDMAIAESFPEDKSSLPFQRRAHDGKMVDIVEI